MRKNGREWTIGVTGYSSEEGLVETFDPRTARPKKGFLESLLVSQSGRTPHLGHLRTFAHIRVRGGTSAQGTKVRQSFIPTCGGTQRKAKKRRT